MAAYSARYEAALALAARAHRNQVRKGTDIPYIAHVAHVSVILIRHGFSEEVAIAGLLHDIVEDQGYPLDQIESEFGPEVAEMVAAASERKREGGAERPWEVRKAEALEQMRRSSVGAVAVKAADALHSTRSIAGALLSVGPSVWSRFKRGPAESLWYYKALFSLASQRLGPHPLVEELAQAVRDLEQVIAQAGSA